MKLRQILINILGNAVNFTPEGGNVLLTVETKAKFDNKSTLLFTIKDTGIGMDKDYLPKIFDAFSQEDSSSTNKYGSSGLGLAITRNLVDMMNGKIEVESEKGAGSSFYVTITLSNSDKDRSVPSLYDIKPQDLNVLIVDDDPVAAEHAALILKNAGISYESASSGAEAVEMVRLRQARRMSYNTILMDWKMPEMDGLNAHLSKPVEPGVLFETLETLIKD